MNRVLLVSLLLALPAASAATTVTAEDGDLELQPGSSASIAVNVTMDCADFVGAGNTEMTYSIESDAPADWGGSGDDITLSAGPDCVTGSGSVTGSGDLTFNPATDAFGLQPMAITIYAVSGDTNESYARSGDIWVAYEPGHTLTPDLTFPHTYTGGGEVVFNLTLDVQANSDTMVMFFPEMTAADGTVSGLGHEQFFFTNGEDPTRVKTITWSPPSGSWESANITFNQYSHCLLGGEIDSCDPQFEEMVTWTINNGAGGGSDEGEDSPGLGAGLLIGLLAAAFVAYRRR